MKLPWFIIERARVRRLELYLADVIEQVDRMRCRELYSPVLDRVAGEISGLTYGEAREARCTLAAGHSGPHRFLRE